MSTRKTILVTGATSGIGRESALHLARKGHIVIATGRNEAALASLKADAAGTSLQTVRLDVTSAASIAAAKAEVDKITGGRGLDVLVNNAGYGILGPTAEIGDEDMRKQFDTNVFGLMAVTRAFLEQMRVRGSGRIINVSSVGGRMTIPFFGVYNATKHAVESLSDALRVELRPFGVQVVLIEPGVINTHFGDRSMSEVQKFRRADSPYAPVLDKADELRVRTEKLGVGPIVIARAIERAATSRWPRARYVAPFSSKIMLALIRITPTRLVDSVFARLLGLTRKNMVGRSAAAGAKKADGAAHRAAA